MAIMHICSRCKMSFPRERMETPARFCKSCGKKFREECDKQKSMNAAAEEMVK